MRPVCLAALALVLIAPVGCDSSSPKSKPDPLHSYDGRVIRGWLLALERQDYEQAAYYFAPGALIDQGHPYRLKTKSDAFAFNASLPCRAELIAMRGGGAHVLATFRLRKGPGGGCSGLARPLHDPERQVHRVAPASGHQERSRSSSILCRSARRLSRRSCASRSRRFSSCVTALIGGISVGLPSSSMATIVR